MPRTSLGTALLFLVLALLVSSSFAAGSRSSSERSPSDGPAAIPLPGSGVAGNSTSPSLSQPTMPSSPAAGSLAATAAPATTHALAETKALGLRPNVVFVPRPAATSAELGAARENGYISPLYAGSPAPMGLAYYGLSAGPDGQVEPTVVDTTGLEAMVDANGTGIQALDLFQSSPDSYGTQLNAVLTNVTLFGHSGFSFWTQNVVEFSPAEHEMTLVTNVWNFSASGSEITANTFYGHGPHGTNDSAVLGYYYAEMAVPGPVSYPFNLTLFLNSTVTDGRDAVDFTVQLTSSAVPSENFTAPYDYVVFNSIKAGGTPVEGTAEFTANGRTYNPVGLTDDFELILGGPGGGSQATLFDADAALGLAYWTGSGYESVPAAYDYGGETGETATGASIGWSNSSGGPAGLTTYGTMTTGPSILNGLWNATGAEGSYPVFLNVTPANALDLLTPVGGSPDFVDAQPAVSPEAFTNTVYLAPGNYSLLTELSDYAPVTTALSVTGPMDLSVNLTPDRALGIYTPLWAFSNAELAALSTSGNGTALAPYVVENNQTGPIGASFGLYNDFAFPVYPAVFLYGTNASVEFDRPPSFSTLTNSRVYYPGGELPTTNDLQYWFWNVSNVSIVNAANISGWFATTTYYPTAFDPFSVVFYEGGHDLVAADTFDSEGEGLLLFSGGAVFTPSGGPETVNVGGGNTTVWGNRFQEVLAPSSRYPLLDRSYGLALAIAEGNDLVYNNYVATATTVWLLPMNLAVGFPELFNDTFNISRQPATDVHLAAGFPLEALSGSIVSTAYQGGNYWWDYGLEENPINGADDPYGLLPYEERAETPLPAIYGSEYYSATYLFPGGDYVPLVPVSLYAVTVGTSGLPAGLSWGANVSRTNGTELDNTSAATPTTVVYLPNGSYVVKGEAPPGWSYTKAHALAFSVVGSATTITVPFGLARGFHALTFLEHGLAKGTTWTVTLDVTAGPPGRSMPDLNATETSTTGSLKFAMIAGSTYSYAASPVTGYVFDSPSSGSGVAPAGAMAIHLRFGPMVFQVTFDASGLPVGTLWKVKVDGKSWSTHGSEIVVPLQNGTYSFTVRSPSGYTAAPAAGTLTVAGGPTTVSVTFSPE